MTILNATIAVLIGTVARDIVNSLYFEVRYRLRKNKPNKYQFILDNLDEEEE
jgi:hypothetical protein